MTDGFNNAMAKMTFKKNLQYVKTKDPRPYYNRKGLSFSNLKVQGKNQEDIANFMVGKVQKRRG